MWFKEESERVHLVLQSIKNFLKTDILPCSTGHSFQMGSSH